MDPSTKVEFNSWPVEATGRSSEPRKRYTYIAIAAISLLCLSMGYLFALYYERDEIDPGSLVLCSAIFVAGFLAIMVPSIVYLRVYNPFWTVLLFGISLGLLFLLVSHKFLITKHKKTLSDDFVAREAFSAYVSAGLLEEIVKTVTYLVPIILCKQYRTVYDLAYFAICSGCSFATLENLTTAYYGPTTAFHRFLWCTATHSSDCLVGALILAHIKTKDLGHIRWILYPLVLIIPVTLHGSYDFVIFLSDDKEMDWLRFLSVLIGGISLFVTACLFWPYRRAAQPKSDVIVIVPSQSALYPVV